MYLANFGKAYLMVILAVTALTTGGICTDVHGYDPPNGQEIAVRTGSGVVQVHGLHQSVGAANGVTHHFLAGAKVGALFAFGIELNYLLKSKERKILYLAAAAQTSIVLSALNGGGGLYITNWGLGIGVRYNHVFRLYDENISIGIPGYSPEVVWYKEMGPNKNWYINLRAATIITSEDFWPDISFGIFLPLNR